MRRSIVRRLLLVAICGFGALVAVLAVLVVPDQTRPIPQPKIGVEVLLSQGTNGARSDFGAGNRTRRTAPALAATTASSGFAPDSRIEDLVLADLRERLRPFPDLAKVPDDLRPTAEEWNRAMDDMASSFTSLAASSAGMSYGKASSALNAIANRWGDLQAEYAKRFSRKPGDPLFDPRENELRKAYHKVFFKISAEHDDWRGAAGFCVALAGLPIPDKRSVWWERTVSCLRRSDRGIDDRLALAVFSTAHAWVPLVKALADGTQIGKFIEETETRLGPIKDSAQ